MTTREKMKTEGGNLGWCKPYTSDDGRYAIAINDGKVAGMILHGEDVAPSKLGNPETLREFAKAVNPDYSVYSGWSDLHIALDGNVKERECADCPWFNDCAAMDEEAGEK